MKLTKFEHSCLDINEGNDRLIIDPGIFSKSFTDFENISAVVITHIHPDHLDETKIKLIIQVNPAVKIFTTQEVADVLKSDRVVAPNIKESYHIGAFELQFYGGQHAIIAEDYPSAQNYGVLVNKKFYYPGDSITTCPEAYSLLALPTMAPWLKFSDSADFIKSSSAQTFFPTHNGFVNDDGQGLYDRMFGMLADATGKTYRAIKTGESLEI